MRRKAPNAASTSAGCCAAKSCDRASACTAGRSAGLFELAVRPSWRFVRAYFLRLGILDGWQGFYIARLTAFSTLTRYALVREAEAGQGGSP